MYMDLIYHLITIMFKGDKNFSYLNRNNWEVDGGPTVGGDEEYEQWERLPSRISIWMEIK